MKTPHQLTEIAANPMLANEATRELLDEVECKLLDNDVAFALDRLHSGLDDLRRVLPFADWRNLVETVIRKHAVLPLIHQEPMTLHSYIKPRGYAGDAELMDYPYGSCRLPADVSALGRALYEANYQHAVCQSVRTRRDTITAMVDETADVVKMPRILSIACGHLREAQQSQAVSEGRIGKYTALDQDTKSLALVAREQSSLRVETVLGSVRSILAGKTSFTEYDFVYSAGLYDYLSEPIAIRMTTLMFSMVRSGGRLLIANFAPHSRGTAYMESLMDWWLIHRSEQELLVCASGIPPEQIREKRLFWDQDQNVIYLELEK